MLAGQTPGFTGADLANLINESALLTARKGNREITMVELEEGIMRVIAGPEKKTRVMGEKERLITAYHEMGHAIVGHLLPNCDPVHKVSIISRGQALGYTISLPTEDKFLTTRAELADTMAMTLGGRAAEEIVFDEITTGASNDLEKVTETAKQMVMRYGMSERLGPRVFGHDRGQPFLGREFSSEPDYSDEIAREIDDEIRRVVEEAHQTRQGHPQRAPRRARALISKILLERETIDAEEFVALLDGATEEEVFGSADDDERLGAGRRRRRGVAAASPSARRRGRSRPRRVPASPAAPRRCAPTTATTDGTRSARPDGIITPHAAARHGHRQRHPGLVLRRRALPRLRGRDRPRPRAARPPGPTSSTSAASRPGRAPRRSTPRRRSRASIPVIEALAGEGAPGLDRHLEGRGRGGGARRRARRSSTTSPPSRDPGDGGALRRARRPD